jgi:hypothetical protein
VVDHHVDRPEVQAQQCVQPTGPNRSMALPIPSPKAARAAFGLPLARRFTTLAQAPPVRRRLLDPPPAPDHRQKRWPMGASVALLTRYAFAAPG